MINKQKDYDYIYNYHFQVITNSYDRVSKIRNMIDNLYSKRLEPFRFGVCLWVRAGEILGHVTLRTTFHRGYS